MPEPKGKSSAEQAADEQATDAALGAAASAESGAQLDEANQRALRAQAELENYRKRVQREINDERRYAVLPLARDLLPVVDNLERAIEAAQKTSDSGGLLDGVKMIAGQINAILKQHQCERIETVGQVFDPNFHQAIAQEPSTEHPQGTITRSAQAGYRLHDRVIRPAHVFVSTGPASS